MATSLDTKIRPKVESILASYGTNLTFDVPGSESYDRTTGKTTEGGVVSHTVKGSLPSSPDAYESEYFAGEVIKGQNLTTTVSAVDVEDEGFTPAQGQTVTFDSVKWDVMAVKVHRSGDQVAAYELLLRR